MRANRYVVVAWFFCVFLVFTSTAHAQDYNEIFIRPGDPGAMHEISQYDVLAIRLRCNPSTGYTWEPKDMPPFLQMVGEEEFIPDSDLIGSPGELVLRFAGKGTGQGTLQLVHHRPWDKEQTLINECTVTVKSQGTFQGTIPNHHGSLGAPKAISSSSQNLGLPTSFNWCDHGGCSSVKNQGSCGSCWAFATVGPLECNIIIKDGIEKDLAEQYLLSCNTDGYDCAGGWFAMEYFLDKIPPGEPDAGTVYEAQAAYTASDATPCNSPYSHHEKIVDFDCVGDCYGIPTPEALKQAIYTYGPIAVAVYVGTAFNNYSNGIFTTNADYQPNHGVVLTGWDESGAVPYWYMKNSWGPGWGENGYMRIKYGVSRIGYGAMYLDYPGAPLGPRSQFSFTTYPDNTTVDFVDESTCGACTIISRQWNFGDGTGSSQQHPSHTYATEGLYTVSLTVTSDTAQSNTVSYTVAVPTPLEYCASQAQGIGTWINTVAVGDFSHSSGETVYSDFTTEGIDVDAATTYPLSINLGAGGFMYQNWFSLWIDINRDGDFLDAGEKVYQSPSAHYGDETGTISIPDMGSITTTMRVSVKRKILASPSAPEPCEEFYRGEVEDYTVRIYADPVSCESDLDLDFDVDGFDLAQYAEGIAGPTLAVFAGQFGSPDCR